jgi:hypothetical protein
MPESFNGDQNNADPIVVFKNRRGVDDPPLPNATSRLVSLAALKHILPLLVLGHSLTVYAQDSLPLEHNLKSDSFGHRPTTDSLCYLTTTSLRHF